MCTSLNWPSDDQGGTRRGQSCLAWIALRRDPTGRPALHFHRDPTYMRSEVVIHGSWAQNQTYYMVYEFMLGNVHEGLWIMQWKKEDKSAKPVQNIPFSIGFTESLPTRLAVFYTPPGHKRKTIYTSHTPFTTLKIHRIDLAWDTTLGSGRIEMWFDGERVMDEDRVDMWTGSTAPKVGMYRAEKGSHDTVGQSNVFDSWVYRVVIGNKGWGEIWDPEEVVRRTRKIGAGLSKYSYSLRSCY